MSPEVEPGPAYDDDRGLLVPVEFGGLPFDPQRTFVVSATHGGVARGGHRAGCRELMVLVHGSVTVTLAPADGPSTCHVLTSPGDRILIDPDHQVDYVLATSGTTVLVLADRPFLDATAGREDRA